MVTLSLIVTFCSRLPWEVWRTAGVSREGTPRSCNWLHPRKHLTFYNGTGKLTKKRMCITRSIDSHLPNLSTHFGERQCGSDEGKREDNKCGVVEDVLVRGRRNPRFYSSYQTCRDYPEDQFGSLSCTTILFAVSHRHYRALQPSCSRTLLCSIIPPTQACSPAPSRWRTRRYY